MRNGKLAVATAGLALIGALAASPAASAARATATAPKAPVVVENFKPVLACNENTTVGQEGCQEHKVLRADKELNADIVLIFGLLGATAKRDFVTAQDAWVTYRHDDCVSQSDVYLGGTEQPVVYGTCLYTQDLARRQDLKGLYATLVQDRPKALKFP